MLLRARRGLLWNPVECNVKDLVEIRKASLRQGMAPAPHRAAAHRAAPALLLAARLGRRLAMGAAPIASV